VTGAWGAEKEKTIESGTRQLHKAAIMEPPWATELWPDVGKVVGMVEHFSTEGAIYAGSNDKVVKLIEPGTVDWGSTPTSPIIRHFREPARPFPRERSLAQAVRDYFSLWRSGRNQGFTDNSDDYKLSWDCHENLASAEGKSEGTWLELKPRSLPANSARLRLGVRGACCGKQDGVGR
jgi:hypothetical protein